jgi:fructokinase
MSPVAVFGEMLVDQFDSGIAVIGGAPFNVARHLAAFGHAPLMLSAVGQDAAAQLIMSEFERYGMRRDGVQVTPSHPTGVVDVRTDAPGGHQFFIRTGSAWDVIEAAPAHAAMRGLAGDAWLYSGTLALRHAVSRNTGLALLRSHAGPKYLDLNWRAGHVSPDVALQAVGLADVLKVNEEELAMLAGWLGLQGAPDGIENCANFVLRHLRLKMLLVTRGAAGALAFDSAGQRTGCDGSGREVQLVDTVGAGDAFSAVMLAGELRGWDVATALARATEFAGHICEVRGAVPPDLAAYQDWTASWT